MFRLIQNGKARAKCRNEVDAIASALNNRAGGAVTIQRQQRSSTNPDGKWHWKRHMLIEQSDMPNPFSESFKP